MEAGSKILNISFNHGRTTFVAATDKGFTMYRVNPLEKICDRNLGGGLSIAVQLFETNFFGLVGGGDNPLHPVNQFVLWNDYPAPNGAPVLQRTEKDKIVAVKLNHDITALVTRKTATLYSLKDMSVVKKIKTGTNPDGICDMSSTKGSVFLCPGQEPGTVIVCDYKNGTERIVSCCSHPLKTISLNTVSDQSDMTYNIIPDSLFATTSTEGTLVRIFDVVKQNLVKELRRGSDVCDIYGVNFSPDSRCISVTSSKNTVHVFSINKDFGNQSSRASFLGGYFNSEWSSFGIDFSPIEATTNPGGPQFQTVSDTNGGESVKHYSCIFPTSPTTDGDAFRLLVICCDGSYAIHDLQFKDRKTIPRASGLLQKLPCRTLEIEME
jgi:WD40 repeat protein